MTERRKGKNKHHHTTTKPHHYNYLNGKVVLLIGNNTSVLHTLVIQLAQKGADIALVCRKLSLETVHYLKENVELLGQRFLLIEEIERTPTSADKLMQMIISKLGQLDIFIDLSAQKKEPTPGGSSNGASTERFQPNWTIMQAALEEIRRSYLK